MYPTSNSDKVVDVVGVLVRVGVFAVAAVWAGEFVPLICQQRVGFAMQATEAVR